MTIGLLDLGRHFQHVAPAERLATTVRLAQAAELRYWIAEHHAPFTALPAPEVAFPLLAANTERLRLGPGGVLLPCYSPLKVAEVYGTLVQAFGERFELGVCRGPGVQGEETKRQLLGGRSLDGADARGIRRQGACAGGRTGRPRRRTRPRASGSWDRAGARRDWPSRLTRGSRMRAFCGRTR